MRASFGAVGGSAPNEAKYGTELGVQGGLLSRVDAGVKTTLAAFEGDFEALLVDGSDLELALLPGVIVAEDGDVDPLFDEDDSANEEDGFPILAVRASLLGGLAVSPEVQLLFGPDLHLGTWNGERLARAASPRVWTVRRRRPRRFRPRSPRRTRARAITSWASAAMPACTSGRSAAA